MVVEHESHKIREKGAEKKRIIVHSEKECGGR
jgi:hypothetical protein